MAQPRHAQHKISHNPQGLIETIDGVRRPWTIPELKLICSFPEDYILCGRMLEQWKRLGNAVPPLMMAAIARAVHENILKYQEPVS